MAGVFIDRDFSKDDTALTFDVDMTCYDFGGEPRIHGHITVGSGHDRIHLTGLSDDELHVLALRCHELLARMRNERAKAERMAAAETVEGGP